MLSLNCVESRDIGTFPPNVFMAQAHKMSQTYFFGLLPGNLTYLHQTLHTASVDQPDKKLSKEF